MVLPMASAPLENGAIEIGADGRLEAVGRFSELSKNFHGEQLDLGEQVLMPGLINAHCHLDYSSMRHAIQPQKDFSAWIRRINALKRSLQAEDFLHAIRSGIVESIHHGTTTICNLEAFPELMPRLGTPPIRIWWFYEMIDVRHPDPTPERVIGTLFWLDEMSKAPGGIGLNPHAPYTASPELYASANQAAAALGIPITTHLAESEEERSMFVDGRGPLKDFLQLLGRSMHDVGFGSALERLCKTGGLNPRWIVAHLNTIERGDWDLLLPGGDLHGLTVVHCPQSHRYFKHPEFAAERLMACGANLCLGTDSLASAYELNLFRETNLFASEFPGIAPNEILDMVTRNPARALDQQDHLGVLQKGAWADWISVPDHGPLSDVQNRVIHYRGEVSNVAVAGQRIFSLD